MFNKSNSKKYIVLTLNFVKKNHKHFLKYINSQSQKNYAEKENLKKNLNILEDGASGYASSDIEEVILKILLKM